MRVWDLLVLNAGLHGGIWGIFELYFNVEMNCYKCVDIKSRHKQCVTQKRDWSDVYTRLVELLCATKNGILFFPI